MSLALLRSDYQPDSLRVILAAIDKHLKHNDSKISMRSRQVQTGPGGKRKSSSPKSPRKIYEHNLNINNPFYQIGRQISGMHSLIFNEFLKVCL